MTRLPRRGEVAGAPVELLDLGGELDLQPRVAEGHRRLVGDVCEQPVLERRGRRARAAGRNVIEPSGPASPTIGHDEVGSPRSSSAPRPAMEGQTSTRSAPASTSRRTTTRSAWTASPAAAAMAGSTPGAGLWPIRRLKSASASYGAARVP